MTDGPGQQVGARVRTDDVPDRGAPRPARWRERGLEALLPWSGARSSAFVDSVGEIARVLSSGLSIDEVLQTVADHARHVVEAEKVILCLAPEGADMSANLEGARIVVRGSRDQHPESWWRDEVVGLAARAGESRRPEMARTAGVSIMCVPILSREAVIGVIAGITSSRRGFPGDRVALTALLAALAGAAIENARLARRTQYSLLADERSRIAKEMHDGLSQRLFGVSLALENCRKRLDTREPDVGARLDKTQELVLQSLAEVRRYIYDLRPLNLDRLGLAGSVNLFVNDMCASAGLYGRFYVEGPERPVSPAAEACLYRVAQEAVTNVVRHARARSMTVLLVYDDRSLELIVEDDGQGFDVAAALAESREGASIGLRSMRDRVSTLSGTLRVESGRTTGSTIRARVPSA